MVAKSVLYLSTMPMCEGKSGIFNLTPETANKLRDLVTFEHAPTQNDIITRALKTVNLLKYAGIFPPQKVMIGLNPMLISTFEWVLSVNGYEIVYLFYGSDGAKFVQITNGRIPTKYYEVIMD